MVEAGQVLGGRYALTDQRKGSTDRAVWNATDQWSDRRVVLAQVPLPEDAERRAAVRRLLGREVQIAGGLAHPHLSQVLGVVTDDESGIWVAGEVRAAGRTLDEVLDPGGHADPARLARWGRDLADGLAALHAHGLVHRAVRPDLVAIRDDGSAGLLAVAATADRAVDHGPGPDTAGPAAAADVADLSGMLRAALPDHDGRALRSVLDGEAPPTAAQLRDALAGLVPGQPTSAALSPAGPSPAGGDDRVGDGSGATAVVERPVGAGASGDGEGRTERLDRPEPGTAAPTPVHAADTMHGQRPRVPAPVTAPGLVPPPAAMGSNPAAAPGPGGGPPRFWPPAQAPSWPGGPVPGGPPPAGKRSRRRGLLVGAAIVVVLAVVAAVALFAFLPRSPDGTAAAAGTPSTPAAGALGEPRRANACDLLSPASYTAFGQALLFADYGSYPSCTVDVTRGAGRVRVQATLYAPGEITTTRVDDRVGDVTIARFPTGDRECSRYLRLPDGTSAQVQSFVAEGPARSDLCAVADAGTGPAAQALSRRSVGARVVDAADPLEPVDACTLIDAGAATGIAGLDTTRVTPGFGNWSCSVGINPAFRNEPYGFVSLTRKGPLDGTPTRIGRHSAVVTPNPAVDGYARSCDVDLVQRAYTGSSGNPRVGVVEVTFYGLGTQSTDQQNCAAATALATAAEKKLPPPT